jgi:hypothetical protein
VVALRLNAVGGRFENLTDSTAGKVFFLRLNRDLHLFAWKSTANKHDAPVSVARDRITACDEAIWAYG